VTAILIFLGITVYGILSPPKATSNIADQKSN
jgi:hypothetical protein